MAWTDLGAWTSRATISKTRLDQITDNFTELKNHTHDNTDGDGATLTNAALSNRTRYLPMSVMGWDVTPGTSRYWTFANAATSTIIFGAKLPADYVSGAVTINFLYGSTVTSNNLRITVIVYQDRDGQAEASLDTNTSTRAVSGSASVMTLYSDAVTTNPNTAASNHVKVLIQRIGADAADTNTGTMNITTPWLEYTADM